MRNIKLTISYDGTGYNGWQFQPNGRTIQGEIERAIEKVFKKKYRIYGASRTDSGVHAKRQVANFKTSSNIPINKVPKALNAILPLDIAVISAKEVPLDFHAQFKARSKRYRYYIYNSQKKSPFANRYSWKVPYKLNMALMKQEAKNLLGEHDFKSFQAKDKKERSSIRRILDISIKKKGSFIMIDVEATGFLYNMVRNIVGTLVEIGRGYLPPITIKNILKKKDRTLAGPTAPSKGLFLLKVKY